MSNKEDQLSQKNKLNIITINCVNSIDEYHYNISGNQPNKVIIISNRHIKQRHIKQVRSWRQPISRNDNVDPGLP